MSRVPALEPGTCQVWWVQPDKVGPEYDVLLGPAELDRRSRLHLLADRQRLTAAAAVVRLVLGETIGRPPDQLDFDRTCPRCGAPHGKPQLAGATGLQFSVSHSGGSVVVAVARDSAVGVDVEEVGTPEPAELADTAELVLAPSERRRVARWPERRRPQAFTTYWTRKEAVLKATGQGLTTSPAHLVVTPPSAAPRVLRWPSAPVPLEELVLHPLHPPRGLVAALAVLGPARARVVEGDGTELLRQMPDRRVSVLPGPSHAHSQSSRRLSSATTRSQRAP
jgi:4'-phosphopantetheinyl transferase